MTDRKTTIENIKREYDGSRYLYEGYCEELNRQLTYICKENKIELSFPIEYRVKEWPSLERKIINHTEHKALADFNDIAGLRIITTFRQDVDRVVQLIRESFIVKNEENTISRLKENEFGYESVHLEIYPKEDWGGIPTMRAFVGLKAEIQVRSAAQHIWAVASHKLQYKQEESVPMELRRSVNRLAALLELVDIEFSKMVEERREYDKQLKTQNIDDERINVSNLEVLLDKIYPAKNKLTHEPYGDLIIQMTELGVTTIEQLQEILHKWHDEVMQEEDEMIQEMGVDNPTVKAKGAFFAHVGLVRNALAQEFNISFQGKKIVKNEEEA